jgi:hypothetical protein
MEQGSRQTSIGAIVTELPAVLERSRPFPLFGSAAPTCFDFNVRSLVATDLGLIVGTTGIGGARLAHFRAGVPCEATVGGDAIAVPLEPAKLARLRLVVPAEAFPTQAADAQLLLIEPGRSSRAVPLKIRLRGYPPQIEVLIWVLTVGLPAVGGAILTFFFARLTARSGQRAQQESDLARFQSERRERLSEFFPGMYRNVHELHGNEFTQKMMTELTQEGILGALPARESGHLVAAIRRADKAKVSRILAAAFPEFRQQIEGS